MDAASTQNQTARREVGCLDELHQVFDRGFRILYEVERGVADFAQVVGRNAGGHAHCNTLAPIHQQVRKLGRQDNWFFFGAIEVVRKINRVLVDTVDQAHGQAGQATFGIPHGSWWVVW